MRPGSSRDRRERGPRGPLVGPGGPAAGRRPTARDRFDAHLVSAAAEIDARWHDRLGLVDYAVEDVPSVVSTIGEVPLGALIRDPGAGVARVVVFRRPIERRCPDGASLPALVRDVVTEQVSRLLDVPPDTVDPRFPRSSPPPR